MNAERFASLSTTERETYLNASKERKVLIKSTSRLSLPIEQRLPLALLTSFLAGESSFATPKSRSSRHKCSLLGLSHGSHTTGLRFRAENAHRLPSTPTGWFLYHKSKNYNMAFGGVKEGLRMGMKVCFWTGAFFGSEEVFDTWRGRRDALNTMAAALGVSGGFSLWNRFDVRTAAKTAKGALAIGLAFGLAQDAVAAMKGRPPGYVDFILRRGRRKEGETSAAMTIPLSDG